MRSGILCCLLLAVAVVAVSGSYPLPNSNLYLWGANQNSCLGFGPSQCSVPLPLPIINNNQVLDAQIAQVVSGVAHTIALMEDGTVFVMGDNSLGQLGILSSTLSNSRSFVQLSLPEIASVAAGDYFSLFLTADGQVFAAGDNSLGQLCAAVAQSSIVSPVSSIGGLSGITLAKAGADHSLFLGSAGHVFACGSNSNGQLGLNSVSAFEDSAQAVSLNVDSAVVSIAAGNKFSVFVTEKGSVYGAGSNALGQLFGVQSNVVSVPTLLQSQGVANIVAVAAGADHMVLLTASGQAFAAGSNANGQLGDPAVAVSGVAVLGAGLKVAAIATGATFSSVLTNDGRIFSVGDNSQGSLGVGSYSNSQVLQEVSTSSLPIHALVAASPNSLVAGFSSVRVQLSSASLVGGNLLGVGASAALQVNLGQIADFYGSIPLSLNIDGPMSASSSVLSLSGRSVTPVLLSCINTGSSKIQISSPFLISPISFVATCFGSISVQFFDPADTLQLHPLQPVVPLTGELNAVFTLNPPAPSPVRLGIASSLPNVARPSLDRLSYTTGASTREITILSPINGEIGIATFYVAAEQAGSYGVLTFNFTVVGSVSVAFPTCIDASQNNVVTVTIDPPATGAVDIALAATNGLLSTAILVIPNGLSSGTFTISGGRAAPGTLSLRSAIYAALDTPYVIKAGLKFSGPTNLLQGAPQNLTVTLVPNPAASFQVSYSTSNVGVSPASPLVFVPGKSSQSLQLTAGSTGAASVSFSGTNFCSSTYSVTVGAAVLCSQGSTPDATGKVCALCPGNSVSSLTGLSVLTNSCNNVGSCTFSNCFAATARCVCPSTAFGTACEFGSSSVVTAVSLGATAVVANVAGFSQSTGSATLNVPANVILKTQQTGTLYVAPFSYASPFPGQVDPATTTPLNTFSTEVGFSVSAACADNTPISTSFISQPSISIPVDPSAFTSTQLSQFTLYYWTGLKWNAASSLCSLTTSVDIATSTVTTQICQAGIYNFFIVPPSQTPSTTGNSNQLNPPPTDISGGHPLEATTGISGVQPPAGAGPTFPPDTKYDPSPNAASPLSFSLALIVASILASLLL